MPRRRTSHQSSTQTSVEGHRDYRVRIPDNVGPGQEFRVMCGSRLVRVVVPEGAVSGQSLQISVPNDTIRRPPPPPVNPSSPRARYRQEYISIRVPPGVQPGQQFRAIIEGKSLMVTCPLNTNVGDLVRIMLPESEPRYEVIVPYGVGAGQEFMVNVNGESITLKVPNGVHVSPGQKLRFTMPKTPFAQSKHITRTPQIIYGDNHWRRNVEPDGKLSWTRSDLPEGDTISFVRFLHKSKETLDFHPANQVTLKSSYTINSGRKLFSHSDLLRVHRQDFKSKCFWFSNRCKELRVEWSIGHIQMNIRRNMVLEDSIAAVNNLSSYDLRKIWKVNFIGEDGLDAGGLSRELFELISKAIFNPDLGLWQPSPNNPEEMEISPASGVFVDNHLELFRFFGKILGKALFDSQLISGRFSPYMVKHLLGWPMSLEDLQYLDGTYHNSLTQLMQLDQDGDDLSSLYLNFTVTQSAAGSSTTEELIPNGTNVELTNENLVKYLEESLKHRVFTRIRLQLKELLIGFTEVIPEQLLVVFDVHELALLLSGPTSINLEDWMQHTNYEGDYKNIKEDHPTCRWFWEIIRSFDEKEKRRFLLFATGSSGVPGRGFEFLQGNDGSIQKFTLTSTNMSVHPISHTCFNRIDLPVYESKEKLQEALLESMANSSEFTME